MPAKGVLRSSILVIVAIFAANLLDWYVEKYGTDVPTPTSSPICPNRTEK